MAKKKAAAPSPKLVYCKDTPPLAIYMASAFRNFSIACEEVDKPVTLTLSTEDYQVVGELAIVRFIMGYPADPLERAQEETWIEFVVTRVGPLRLSVGNSPHVPRPVDTLAVLDSHLSFREFIAGSTPGPADMLAAAALPAVPEKMFGRFPNVRRYLESIDISVFNKRALGMLKSVAAKRQREEAARAKAAEIARKQAAVKTKQTTVAHTGGTPTLPGAEFGKVVTRFPPEPSGYLHIGHAKAALLSEYFARFYRGRLHFRFDDTNPARESVDFSESILKDLAALHIAPDTRSHTSDHFEYFQECCARLIAEGRAYCDDTPTDTMREMRRNRQATPNRTAPPALMLEKWEEMKKGSAEGQRYCVRAKIDMESDVSCLRDPVLFRYSAVPHPRTGSRYCIYPTYDFACPIVDSIEGITHALRTTEFLDRDESYRWVCEALGLRVPWVGYFSRLNMRFTVMSKRKLQWFVDKGIVESWSDPRFPTVQGILRRGMTVEALKRFVVLQGLNRNINFMEWDKIWAVNRQVIDPVAPRYFAVEKHGAVPCRVSGLAAEVRTVPLHKKNAAVGQKRQPIGPDLLIDQADAREVRSGSVVTLMNIGNAHVDSIETDEAGAVRSMALTFRPEDKDFRKTLKLTWLCAPSDAAPLASARIEYFGNLITEPILRPEMEIEKICTKKSKHAVAAYVEAPLLDCTPGTILQIERRGFFFLDRIEDGVAVLHNTPEGRRAGQHHAFGFE
eukprot:gnl/Chilomastix_cuspidata/1146.p2 GENE.gnl/Chilomastix_cuspidata/1146~~gnl/Chilomastix_cuspidata/1146.p2  ORF type:complete len:735 (+),score=360.48 gnl/Chilomastix_cuspidata/1146:615-2819(+)